MSKHSTLCALLLCVLASWRENLSHAVEAKTQSENAKSFAIALLMKMSHLRRISPDKFENKRFLFRRIVLNSLKINPPADSNLSRCKKVMKKAGRATSLLSLVILLLCLPDIATAQSRQNSDMEFGPVVRAYLGYLKNEQEVVDDRVSRREITRNYYVRNSNRIRALRQVAMRIARETRNDYLPELEAVTPDEFHTIFEYPPRPGTFGTGQVLSNTFRFMGTVRSGELFYIFARLDPYEQADLIEHSQQGTATTTQAGNSAQHTGTATSRPRRVGSP